MALRIHGGRSRTQRGVTLVELLVAVLIGIGLVAVAVVSLRNMTSVDLRSGARFMASTIRFGFDRARVTGRDHRLLFDLDAEGGSKVTLEIASKGKTLLPRNLDDAWEQQNKLADGGEAKDARQRASKTTIGGLSKNFLALPRPTGPQWSKSSLRSSSALAKLTKAARLVKGVYVARLDQEVTSGKVALHIWGGGRLERAAIYMSDGRGKTYTLVTYPLTGRVRIHDSHVDIPRDQLYQDDTGESIQDR